MLNNKPIPKFSHHGFQTDIKEFKDSGITCNLLKPKLIEIESDVTSVKLESKRRFRPEKLVYCKSKTDMLIIQERDDDIDYDVDGHMIDKHREVHIQVGASLLEDLCNERTQEQTLDNTGQRFKTLESFKESEQLGLSPA